MTYIKGERLAYENYHKLSEKEKDRLACDEAEFLKALHSVEIPDSHPLYSELKLEVKDRFLQDQKKLLTILKAEKLLTPGRQASVSYTHLDVYKRQGLEKASSELHVLLRQDRELFRFHCWILPVE